MAVTSATSVPTVSPQNTGFNGLTADDFLKLLIAQLANQDPSEPVSNSELLGQLSTMRSLQSDIELSSTLKDLAGSLTGTAGQQGIGQQLSLGASYIGRSVTLDDGSLGIVDSAFVVNGDPILGINGSEVPLTSVISVNSPATLVGQRIAFETDERDSLGQRVIGVGQVNQVVDVDGQSALRVTRTGLSQNEAIDVPFGQARQLITSATVSGHVVAAVNTAGELVSGLATPSQTRAGQPAVTVDGETLGLDRIISVAL